MAEPTRIYRRGDIVQVRLDPTEGAEQSGVRPAIVLSPEKLNKHSPVMILAPLTTKNLDRVYPFEVLLEPDEVVKRRSKILLIQLRGMAKSRILNFYGATSPENIEKIDVALQIAVGLDKI